MELPHRRPSPLRLPSEPLLGPSGSHGPRLHFYVVVTPTPNFISPAQLEDRASCRGFRVIRAPRSDAGSAAPIPWAGLSPDGNRSLGGSEALGMGRLPILNARNLKRESPYTHQATAS